jgi:uncharacterized protein YndB with AHSA1/START domain
MTDEIIVCEPLVREHGRVRAVMRLPTEHPASVVWAALTDPGKLASWLAPGEIQLRLGGAVRMAFEHSGVVVDSRVSAFKPHALLEYSWSGPGEPERPIRWILVERRGHATLTLTVLLPESEDPARGCAGWFAHLEMLAIALEGASPQFPFQHFLEKRAVYQVELEAVARRGHAHAA